MAQQTAVEWMIDEIDIAYPDIEIKKKISITAQAKEIEKQQIMNTFDIRKVDIAFDKKTTSEQYYNENYGNATHTPTE